MILSSVKRLWPKSLLCVVIAATLSLRISIFQVGINEFGCVIPQTRRTDEQILFCDDEKPKLPAICEKQREPSSVVIFKDLPPPEPFEACFVSALFGISEAKSDKISDARPWKAKYPNHGFFIYTNLVNMETPGWRKVLYFDRGLKRMETLSRYPKFLAWKDEVIQKYCPVVYYMDVASWPTALLADFQAQTQRVLQSEVGLSQMKHHWGLKRELQAIIQLKKDTKANMDATRSWLEAQPDFSWDCQLYQNTFFGYNPKNPKFQEAALFFWNQYSQETTSWRDQPLWCYTLQRFGMKPIELKERAFFQVVPKQMGGSLGGQVYNRNTNKQVEIFLNSKKGICSTSEAEFHPLAAPTKSPTSLPTLSPTRPQNPEDPVLLKKGPAKSWFEHFPPECKIIFHVHIPKTGGTSILHAMRTMPTFCREIPERQNVYVSDGKNVMNTVVPHLAKILKDGTDFPLLLTLEVGIDSLRRVGYPFFNETCFFATVRNPQEWLVSAENHMRTKSNYKGGFTGKWGFFNKDNIQSRMVFYDNQSIARRVCVYTSDKIQPLLCALNQTQGNICTHGLRHHNVGDYGTNVTPPLVKQIVEKRFLDDVALWSNVVAHNGTLCW